VLLRTLTAHTTSPAAHDTALPTVLVLEVHAKLLLGDPKVAEDITAMRSKADVKAVAFDAVASLCSQFDNREAAIAALNESLNLRVRAIVGWSRSFASVELVAAGCLQRLGEGPLDLPVLARAYRKLIALSPPKDLLPLYEDIVKGRRPSPAAALDKLVLLCKVLNKSMDTTSNRYPKPEAEWVRIVLEVEV
jgi:hypothetical protein